MRVEVNIGVIFSKKSLRTDRASDPRGCMCVSLSLSLYVCLSVSICLCLCQCLRLCLCIAYLRGVVQHLQLRTREAVVHLARHGLLALGVGQKVERLGATARLLRL
jgi:hypothetical protein